MKSLKFIGIGVLATFLTLLGCTGGGGSTTVADAGGGIGGTGVAASGTITGFGSIFVNGVEYFTDQASIEFNDQAGVESQLKLGMKVNVQANVINNVATASSVVFDYAAEGPVSNLTVSPDGLTKMFTILGTTVKVDKTTTVFDNNTVFNFATLANNQLVKVSGLFDANSVLIVDFIESAGSFDINTSVVEIKGLITNLSGNDFTLGSISVVGSSNLENLPNGLSNNIFVEVKGTMSDSTTLVATRIQGEQQEDFSGFEGKVELEGYVTDLISLASFKVNGQLVDATNVTPSLSIISLLNGVKVEVNGNLLNGTLQATELKIEDEGIKLHGLVSAISTSEKKITLTIGTDFIDVTSDTSTLFDDGKGMVENMTLADLFVGDYLEIRASKPESIIIASTVKRDDIDDQLIEGEMDSISTSNVTVLGLSFDLDSSTVYQNQNNTLIQSEFMGLVAAGSIIQVEDKLVNGVVDGVADEVSLE